MVKELTKKHLSQPIDTSNNMEISLEREESGARILTGGGKNREKRQ